MNALVGVFSGLFDALISVISNAVNLANYYSTGWGKYLVYALLIWVSSKLLKIKISISK